MKASIKLLSACLLLLFIISCGEDEAPAKNPLIATWAIDSYIIKNVPDAYNRSEGQELSTLRGETNYEITFDKSGYTRNISVGLIAGGDTVLSETGEYEYLDGELVLDPDGQGFDQYQIFSLFDEFKVENLLPNDLKLSVEITFPLVPNNYYDTVSEKYQTYLRGLPEAEFDSIYDNVLTQPVLVDLLYDFDLKR